MMESMDTKKICEILSSMPFIIKLALCMYIIPAGLNSLYELGYIVGGIIKNIIM